MYSFASTRSMVDRVNWCYRNAIKSLTGGVSTPAPPLDGTSQLKEEKTEVRSPSPHARSFVGQLIVPCPGMQVDEMVEKIYANMSACHLNQKNWQRALETADKVGRMVSSIPPPIGMFVTK